MIVGGHSTMIPFLGATLADFTPDGVAHMRLTLVAVILALLSAPALAADESKDFKGIYLLADYPTVTAQAGATTTVNMHLHNYGMPPERFTLSVAGVPKGWTATVLGGGRPVAAAM